MKKWFLTVIFLAIILSTVNAGIYAEKDSVTIEPDSGINVMLFLENDSSEDTKFELYAKSHSPYIQAELPLDEVFLNSGESTSFNLNIYALEDAPKGFSLIEVRMENGFTDTAFIGVMIAKEDDFRDNLLEITAFDKKLCRKEEGSINIRIENKADFTQEIELYLNSETMNASLEPDYLELLSNEVKYVQLVVPAYPVLGEGTHSVELMIETTSSIMKKEIEFEIIECSGVEELFSLNLEGECIRVSKGSFKEINYSIENLSETEQEINIAITSDLLLDYSKKRIFLDEDEKAELSFTVEADKDTGYGKHLVEVFAFNDSYYEKRTACVYVEQMHEFKARLLNNNLQIERGTTAIFEVEVENTGDYDEDFHISVREKPREVKVIFSEEDFLVRKGESETIYVSVTPSLEAYLGENEIELRLRNSETLTKTLKFKVVEEGTPPERENAVEFKTFPKKIVLNRGDSIEVFLVIENISGKELKDVEFKAEGLPFGVKMDEVMLSLIEEGELIEVSTNISATEGAVKENTSFTLVVENDLFREEKEIELEVREDNPYYSNSENMSVKTTVEKEDSFLAGLIGLGSNSFAGLLGGIIIVLVVLILIVVALSSNPSPRRLRYRGETVGGIVK
ncbi:MAG: hypothetical protein ABIE23_05170 [archaeon]